MMTTIYQAKSVYLLPRPDRLYKQLRSRQAQATIARERVQNILSAFGIQYYDRGEVPNGSGRSDNLIVWTNVGKKLLKGYKTTLDYDAIIHEHSILRRLADVRFPAPRLNLAMNGQSIHQMGERYFAMFDVLEGYFQYHNYLFLPKHSRRFLTCAGQALGDLHTALEDFTPAGCQVNGFKSSDGDRWRDLDWYRNKLDASRRMTLADLVHRDVGEASRLMAQARWIDERLCALDAELGAAALPRLIIHGDYGPYNLFFKPDEPVVILDFELARLDWRLTDLATAIGFFAKDRLGLHRGKMRLFLESYRSRSPIGQDELALLPAVWQFLTLRRAIVCWHRYTQTEASNWLSEALQKLELAQWLDHSREMLTNICRLDKE